MSGQHQAPINSLQFKALYQYITYLTLPPLRKYLWSLNVRTYPIAFLRPPKPLIFLSYTLPDERTKTYLLLGLPSESTHFVSFATLFPPSFTTSAFNLHDRERKLKVWEIKGLIFKLVTCSWSWYIMNLTRF